VKRYTDTRGGVRAKCALAIPVINKSASTPALPVVAGFYYSRPIFQLYGFFIFILQMMRLIDYHETDYIVIFLHYTDLCIFIRTNDATSGIGIGINRSQSIGYCVLSLVSY